MSLLDDKDSQNLSSSFESVDIYQSLKRKIPSPEGARQVSLVVKKTEKNGFLAGSLFFFEEM